MTREEQIQQRLFEISTSNFNSMVDYGAYRAGYLDGIKWADRTMIERACEWLERHTPSNHTSNTITFVEQFIKAMEQ